MEDYDRYLVERVHALAVECSEWFKVPFSVMIDNSNKVFLCEETHEFKPVRGTNDLSNIRNAYEKRARACGVYFND